MSLEAQLAQLETAQLVRAVGHAEYLFKNSLTQETAYSSLLKNTRRAIHAHVARTYEELYADRLDEFAAPLAQHYAEAGDDAQAIRYATLAGDAAARTYANAEAIAFYTQAIDIAKRTGGASLKELYLKRGRVYEVSSQHDRALENYDGMKAVAQATNDRAMELAALIARATIYSIPSRYLDRAHARQLSDQALTLARAIGDQPAEAKILWNMLLFNTRLDTNYREGIACGEQAIAIARALNLQEQLAYLLNDMSLVYVWNGEPERGAQVNLQSREMWRAMNNLPMLVDNLNYAILRHIAVGEYAQAIEVSRESLEISQRIGNEWGTAFNLSWVGEAYREHGDIEQAIAIMRESIRLGEHTFQAPLGFTRADLGALYADLGQAAHGLEHAQLAVEHGKRIAPVIHLYAAAQLAHVHLVNNDLPAAQAAIAQAETLTNLNTTLSTFNMALLQTQAELYLAQDNPTQAVQTCNRMIHHLRSHRLRVHLPSALYLKGLALCRQAKLDEAYACLQDARREADLVESRWMLWCILAALAKVETERGNTNKAENFRTPAREIIAYITEHTPPEFRESFLNSPAVRAGLGNPH